MCIWLQFLLWLAVTTLAKWWWCWGVGTKLTWNMVLTWLIWHLTTLVWSGDMSSQYWLSTWYRLETYYRLTTLLQHNRFLCIQPNLRQIGTKHYQVVMCPLWPVSTHHQLIIMTRAHQWHCGQLSHLGRVVPSFQSVPGLWSPWSQC